MRAGGRQVDAEPAGTEPQRTFAYHKIAHGGAAAEALHRSLCKIIKIRGSYPSDEATLKLLYLAVKNASMRWPGRLNGPPRWNSLPSGSACDFRGERADPRNRNFTSHGALLHKTSDIPSWR